ncbi:predicted protein [Uncinocarpus reesii 1704]|uniref:Uncharacterized protein n=1 Tax=Uncinocarpus reesii (strain UAMH 1704) TaxID=336963 RepID=C4JZX0_UNCRE|nr:uncharacterized protein UREG_07721 [Uncinocarpus reesii 1704]EEP82856.1 predicted protein [Uncinocarpus reesii 1704]
MPKMISILVCVVFASPVLAADAWDDFYNNFATDLTPLLALFGEQVTKQFLSESTSILDLIIFAVAPLGILTAVVSVIRVCGSPSLRAFIGRAQEGQGTAEVELCSSTSNDVCELWQRGGIARVFGKPKILEIVYDRNRGKFYDESDPPSAHIFRSSEYFQQNDIEDDGKPDGTLGFRERLVADERQTTGFAPNPNLSLNLGIKKPSRLWLLTAAFTGCVLQAAVLVFAVWVTYYAKIKKDERPIPTWAFPITSIGTLLLIIGMFLCAWLIETTTAERFFKGKVQMFWLQGSQRIGDQVFDAFAHSANLDEYVTSWKIEGPISKIREQLVWIAVGSALVGFILQFVGLRGLHSFVSLFQLGITVVMAIVRAALRSRRLGEGKNELRDLNICLDGYELDWFAHMIESGNNPQRSIEDTWEVQPNVPQCSNDDPGKDKLQIEGFYGVQSDSVSLTTAWISELESDDLQDLGHPHVAARIMYYRARLSRLADHTIPNLSQDWHAEVQECAGRLQNALENAAEVIFSGDIKLKSGWDDISAIFWRVGVATENPDEGVRPIHITLRQRAELDLVAWVSSSLRDKYSVWGYYDPKCSASPGDAKHPPILSVPLYIQQSKTLNDAGTRTPNCDTQVLYLPSIAALTEMCAQDIFTSFISRAAGIIETLLDFNALEDGGCEIIGLSDTIDSFRLSNGHVHALTKVFNDAELGSWEEGIMSVLPAFQAQSLLTIPETIKTRALELARQARQKEHFVKAEDLLRWIYLHTEDITSPILEQVAKELGELYRRALMNSDIQLRKFGYEGILHRLGSFQDSRYNKINQTYLWVATQISAIKGDTEHVNALTQKLERDLVDGIENMSVSAAFKAEPFYPICLVIAERWQKEVCSQDSGLAAPPLCLAVQRKCRELIEDLLSLESIDVNLQDDNGRTAIFYAAEAGDISIVEYLFAYSPSLGGDNSGQAPLWIAAANGHSAVVTLLLHLGANPEQRDQQGRTPLWIAAHHQHEDAVRALLDAKANIESRDIDGITPLMAAALTESATVLRLLLESGADMIAKAKNGYSPFSYAISSGSVRNMSLFLEKGYHLEDRNILGWTALHTAVADGSPDTKIIKFLLDKGASIEAKDGQGRTPLMAAVELDKPLAVVNCLLEAGALVNVRNERSLTPLDIAVITRREGVVESLLKAGADTECKGNDEMTPLFQSVVNGDAAVTKLLLDHGANPHYKRDTTPLKKAIEEDHYDIMMMLVKKGAFLDMWADYSLPSVARLIQAQYDELLRLLLPQCRNVDCLVPSAKYLLELAEETENERVVNVLLDNGVKPAANDAFWKTAKIAKLDHKAPAKQ